MYSNVPHPPQLTHRPKPTLMFRLTAISMIVSILLSCGFLQPVNPESANPQRLSESESSLQTDGQLKIGDVQIPANPKMRDIERAEQELRNALREPLREALGPEADTLFSEADAAYRQLYLRMWQELEPQSSRAPGLAQLEAFGSVFGLMLGFQGTAAKSEKSDVSFKDNINFSETLNIQIKVNFTKSGSKLMADVEMTLTAGKEGSQLVETAKGKYDVELCPDAQGHAKVNFDLNMDARGSGEGKSAGMQFSIQGSGKGIVNDEAVLAGMDMDITSGLSHQTSTAETGGQIKGEFAEVRTSYTIGNPNDPSKAGISNFSSKTTRASSAATQATVDAAAKLGILLGNMFSAFSLSSAEKDWQNGYCLEILVDGAQDSNQLRPGDSRAFTARVHHKFEGADIKAPIIGALSGERSLKPLEKTDSPVDYTYEAPPEKDKEATVKLETKSKRGGAKYDLSFKIVEQSYTVSGKSGDLSFTGVICDPYRPFTINGAGGGGSAVFDFTPAGDALNGQYTYKGKVGPISLFGGGPYIIKLNGDGSGTLEIGGEGCISTGDCASGVDTLQLSPLQDASACK
jgi:hypothetical protein